MAAAGRGAVSFRTLDATHIIGTIERLNHRIEERFPGAGLSGVGRDLFGLARECAREAEALGVPRCASGSPPPSCS